MKKMYSHIHSFDSHCSVYCLEEIQQSYILHNIKLNNIPISCLSIATRTNKLGTTLLLTNLYIFHTQCHYFTNTSNVITSLISYLSFHDLFYLYHMSSY